MAGNQKRSRRGTGSYASYKNGLSFGKNKVAKLKRHLKAHPEDSVAAKALADHSKNINPSARWGKKEGSSLSSSKRLIDQLTSKANAAMNQLFYCKDSEALVFKGVLTYPPKKD